MKTICFLPRIEIFCYADKERSPSDCVADVNQSREPSYRRRDWNHRPENDVKYSRLNLSG